MIPQNYFTEKVCATCKTAKPIEEYRTKNMTRGFIYSHCRACTKARTKARSTGFDANEWDKLCESTGRVCLCCKQKKKLTIDHIVPVSRGGTNHISNLQPLCFSCNSSKQSKTIDYR